MGWHKGNAKSSERGACEWYYKRVPIKRYADIIDLGGILSRVLRIFFLMDGGRSIKLNIGS